MSSDRNLLFGILAHQMDFVSRDQLVAGMHAWVLEKENRLGSIFVEQHILDTKRRDLLEALVEAHLANHGNDPEKSLQSLSSIGPLQEELKSHLSDDDVQHSLGHLQAVTEDKPPEDPWATRPLSVGERSSEGTRFRIIRLHEKGGLGEVFKAYDEELNREVALKQIKEEFADHPTSRSRFEFEAEITGALEHPGVVPVYGRGQYADGRPFYAMRFIEGDSLRAAIRRFHEKKWERHQAGERSMALRELLRRVIDVCNAVAYAHSRGVLHRDLKPSNVMLGKYGETLIVDWGLAKATGRKEIAAEPNLDAEAVIRPQSGSGSEPTQMGNVIGTLEYMSPEQAEGRLDLLGPASDVYGLGATLYTLLTGKPPVEADDKRDIQKLVIRGEFPRPRQVNREIAPALESICIKAMAREPADRYASPIELSTDIEHWLADERVAAHPESIAHRAARWGRRHRAWVQATAAALVLVAGVSLASAVALDASRRQTADERDRADENANKERHARVEAETIKAFYEDYVLAATRPKHWSGGLGKDVTLLTVLDNSAENIEEAFRGYPELDASVRNTLGMTYWHLGQFDKSGPHLKAAYKIRLKELGPDHPDTLTSLHNLGMQRWKEDNLSEALALGEKALEARRRVLGKEHEDTLWTQLNYGLYFSMDGQYAAAEPVLRDAIDACTRTLGPYHHHTLYGLNDLAITVNSQGKSEECIAINRKALEGRVKSLGSEHPDTLRSMGNLASALASNGDLDEAESLATQSLETRKRVLGPEHMETLWSQGYLADILRKRGKYSDAEKLAREKVVICVRTFGPSHNDTIVAQRSLARILSAQGRHEEAEDVFRAALEATSRDLGPEDLVTLALQHDLAILFYDQGKLSDAESAFKEVLDKRTRIQGPEHYSVLLVQGWLASVLSDQGKFEEAEAMYRTTLDARIRTIGPEDRQTLVVKHNLASALNRQDKLDEAEALYRETWETEKRALGPENALTLATQHNLSGVLERLERREEAEALYRQTVADMKKFSGELASRTLSAERDHASLLRDLGRANDGAAMLEATLAKLRAKSTDSSLDAEIATTLVSLGDLWIEEQAESAEAVLREGLALREQLQALKWQIANARLLLGISLAAQAKDAEAEPLLQEGYEGLTEAEGDYGRQITRGLERLIKIYEQAEQPEKANLWRTRLPSSEPAAAEE